jgi:cyclic 2,3-diphosphoglycerate synthetase
VSRVVALIDGEHYPPVVRFALDELGSEHDVVGAAFIGGTEKVDAEANQDVYGVEVVRGETADESVLEAIARFGPDTLVDLSDEPVVSDEDRFRLASIALEAGVGYQGSDFRFSPPRAHYEAATPTLAIIGTGKRVGKTSVSAHVARRLKAQGWDIVVLAMGRGGPGEPELIRGEKVELSTEDLLALAAEGKHASSDNYEDAVMSRVTTVGCRRCGGGMAGETFFSNVRAGAELADSLGKELLVAEGSGAAIPPVKADAHLLVVGAMRGERYVRQFFGPYRVHLADAVVIAAAEEPNATPDEVEAVREAVAELKPGISCVATTFRPEPLADVAGRRVFFATTAPAPVLPKLTGYLEERHDCHVVAASPHLSNRTLLREDLRRASGAFDLLLTELKAAAIDVVAMAGQEADTPTVLCDNVPVAVDGGDLEGSIDDIATLAVARGTGGT